MKVSCPKSFAITRRRHVRESLTPRLGVRGRMECKARSKRIWTVQSGCSLWEECGDRRGHPPCERFENPGGVQTQSWEQQEAAEGCKQKSKVNKCVFYKVYSVCSLEKWLQGSGRGSSGVRRSRNSGKNHGIGGGWKGMKCEWSEMPRASLDNNLRWRVRQR